MTDLIQLVYASRSNLHSHEEPTGIETGIGRILLQSRKNNVPRSIGGVLCFGDEHFFQCLEGHRDEVEALYEVIQADDRHFDVTLLLKRPVPQRRFKLWSMKYLALDKDIRDVLDDHGLEAFDPFQFDTSLTEDMLEILQKGIERQHLSRKDPNWKPAPSDAGEAATDTHPLAYLGVGAVMAAVAAIVIFAVGLR